MVTVATDNAEKLAAESVIGGTPAKLELQFALSGNPPAEVERIGAKLPREPGFAQTPAFQHRQHFAPTFLAVNVGQTQPFGQTLDLSTIGNSSEDRDQSIGPRVLHDTNFHRSAGRKAGEKLPTTGNS